MDVRIDEKVSSRAATLPKNLLSRPAVHAAERDGEVLISSAKLEKQEAGA